MPSDILMPALSPTMEHGALAKWHVKPGDTVRPGDVIAEIETDKATMEVEAVDQGVVSEILVAEGAQEVAVGAAIARLSGEGEVAPAAAPQPATSPPPPSIPPRSEPASSVRPLATPLARRIAEQKGIDLSGVVGTGPHGRIIKADVAPPESREPVPAMQPTPVSPRSLEQMGIAPGSYELIPLDGMRRTVARRMAESFRDVPHFPLSMDLEIDALLAARARLNQAIGDGGAKISVNDMILKAAAGALMQVPEANASYTPDGIAMHRRADLAMAVAIDGGLITPIVRGVEGKGLAQIAAETRDLAERARSKRLKPEEFQGGTFSVSNLGMFGVKSFASILNEPQGAILSVGAGQRRPVARGDQLAIATVMSVTLTCDHRAMDGAVGARWLAAFKTRIDDPLMMIA